MAAKTDLVGPEPLQASRRTIAALPARGPAACASEQRGCASARRRPVVGTTQTVSAEQRIDGACSVTEKQPRLAKVVCRVITAPCEACAYFAGPASIFDC
eukprot:1455137-Rhodomonas_salina.1